MCVYIYIYIYIHVYVICIHIYIYIYIYIHMYTYPAGPPAARHTSMKLYECCAVIVFSHVFCVYTSCVYMYSV